METPTVDNLVLYEAQNIQFNVRAYRKLTREEALAVVRMAMAQKKGKPKRNSQVTIISTIGYRD